MNKRWRVIHEKIKGSYFAWRQPVVKINKIYIMTVSVEMV